MKYTVSVIVSVKMLPAMAEPIAINAVLDDVSFCSSGIEFKVIQRIK